MRRRPRPDTEIDGAESSWHCLPANSHAENATRRPCKNKGAWMRHRGRSKTHAACAPSHYPDGGVADSLDEAKAAFRAAGERLLSVPG